MAANIPIKHDEAANQKAFAAVRADKEREASDGNDGSWVAHPGLIPVAMEVYNNVLKEPNQINKLLPSYQVDAHSLTEVPDGQRTDAGFRRNIAVGLGYLDSYLRGVGCVPLYNMMEDYATCEVSRSLLWQWLHHDAKLEDGRTVDPNLVKQTINAETERRLIRAGSVVNRLPEAAELLEQAVLAEELPDFLSLWSYDKLVGEGK